MVWQYKCVEGWSNVVGWTGVRFSDFVRAFAPDEDGWDHVALTTPDGDYYVGVDRYTMLHDQTLPAWKLNGQSSPRARCTAAAGDAVEVRHQAAQGSGPSSLRSGAPPNYWFERGHDYHAGF
ncbi:MAG: hypothetical protein R2715_13385 [Ilumatobacteraceae bacterium]